MAEVNAPTTKYAVEIKGINEKPTKEGEIGLCQGNVVTQTMGNNGLLINVTLTQKMFQPSCLEVVIQTKNPISSYERKLITLYAYNSDDATDANINTLVKNYYIFNIKQKGEYVTLTAYSADKFLTIDKFCQAFTGKTLVGGIVTPTLTSTISENFKLFKTLTGEKIAEELVVNLQNFSTDSIIPYAVQYNESFYDFLVRMCNRDGEFLYFGADNKLHIGLEGNEGKLPATYSAEYTLSYNTEDTSNWVEPDYLGTLRNKDCNYLDNFNVSKVNNNSNINSSCLVLAPEYLEDLTDSKGERGEYVKADEYYTKFSAIAGLINTFTSETSVCDAVRATALSFASDYSHIKKWVTKYNEDYKKQFNLVENSSNNSKNNYLYADDTRTNDKYKEIYNSLEKVKSNQVEIVTSDGGCPSLGSIVELGGINYVVYKFDVNVTLRKFIKREKDNYTQALENEITIEEGYNQEYKLLLVRCEKTSGDDKRKYEAYPLPMPEIRIKKASTQRAKVVDNFDPSRLGRVRVKFPWQSSSDNNSTPWIRVSTPMASKDAGVLFTPLIGDEVLVDFENENVECPYVSGSFYSDSNRPSVLAQSQTNGKVKSITSTNGHHIAFFDNGSAERYAANFMPLAKSAASFGFFDEKIFKGDDAKHFAGGFEISDYHGIYAIKGSTHNRSIDISSPFGTVSIDAFQGITINAPLGDVKIVGKNVSIEARNNLTLESGTNIKNCFGNYVREGFVYSAVDFTNNLLMDNVFGTITGLVDLSFIRNYVEMILRPIGGTMLIKSNRHIRLEAGDGKINPHKVLDHKGKGIARSLLNIEHKTPLQYAKEEALTTYEELVDYKNKIGDAINIYKNINGRENFHDIELFNGDNIKKEKEIEFPDATNNPELNKAFKNSILKVRVVLSECDKKRKKLMESNITAYRNSVTSLWNAAKVSLVFNGPAPELNITITRRQFLYEYLKNRVESIKELNSSLGFGTITGYTNEAIKNAIQEKDDANNDSSWYKPYKDSLIGSAKKFMDVGGFMDLSDDKVWGTNDKGAILLSNDENSFFKMQSDGTFTKGWSHDYKEEFLELMKDVVD